MGFITTRVENSNCSVTLTVIGVDLRMIEKVPPDGCSFWAPVPLLSAPRSKQLQHHQVLKQSIYI